MSRVLTQVEQSMLEEVFKYHAPSADQIERYLKIREAAKTFATVLLENTRPCADQSAALRKVRETVMTANAAIALEHTL